METGISLRLWDHYRRVEVESGIPVWIIFVHHAEREVRGGSLSDLLALEPRPYTGVAMGKHGMIFFPYDSLRLLAPIDDLLIPEAACEECHIWPLRVSP